MRNLFFVILVSVTILVTGCTESKAEENLQVEEQKISAPVQEEKVLPTQKKLSEENLIINSTPEKYSYDNLVSDIEKIKNICPPSAKFRHDF